MTPDSELFPMFVFGLLILAAFGAGIAIVRRIVGQPEGNSALAMPLLAVAFGLAAIGNVLFVAGIFFRAYQRPIIWPLLIVGAAYGCFEVIRWLRTFPRPSLRGLSVWEIATLVLASVYAVRWFNVLKGFTTGDDVFDHHYLHAKYMVKIGGYGHAVFIPWGLDNVSNYNASLTHVLYTIGHLLSDERAANLLHWFTQLMLIAAIYLLGRTLRSRTAGLMAVAMYLGASLLAHEPLSVQDYTMTALLTLLTIYAVIMMRRSGRREWLLLAAVSAGFLASSKNYGLPMLIPVGIFLMFWLEGPLTGRIRAAAVFSGIAFLVYSPWFFYNLITMGDPWFPFLRGAELASILRPLERASMLVPFVIPGHVGSAVPRLVYFASMFIPFEPRYFAFGIGVIPLIGLPVSLYYAMVRRSQTWREINALFVVALGIFFVINWSIGQVAYYKWAIFPAVVYFASLAAVAAEWTPVSRHLAWGFVIAVALLNYQYVASPRIRDYSPTGTQRQRWDALTTFLNDNLSPASTVGGLTAHASYYLRPDLNSIGSFDGLATDWQRDEGILRTARTSYFVTYPNAKEQAAELYQTAIDGAKVLQSGSSQDARFLEQILQKNQQRFRDRDAFLAGSASLWKELPDGSRVYALRGIDRGRG